jgi:hypothetical protein
MIAQAWIAIFGVAAIWLSQDERVNVRRWACVCGLLAQPAWLITTASAGQWGIFALSFLYAWSWAKGVRTYWWRKPV